MIVVEGSLEACLREEWEINNKIEILEYFVGSGTGKPFFGLLAQQNFIYII